jgi:hypothetical protein
LPSPSSPTIVQACISAMRGSQRIMRRSR